MRLHGLPDEIVSDRDPVFALRLWRGVCKLMGMQHSMSSAYHARSDGQTERVNRVLEQMLQAYMV